jgi:hypothetical protein
MTSPFRHSLRLHGLCISNSNPLQTRKLSRHQGDFFLYWFMLLYIFYRNPGKVGSGSQPRLASMPKLTAGMKTRMPMPKQTEDGRQWQATTRMPMPSCLVPFCPPFLPRSVPPSQPPLLPANKGPRAKGVATSRRSLRCSGLSLSLAGTG